MVGILKVIVSAPVCALAHSIASRKDPALLAVLSMSLVVLTTSEQVIGPTLVTVPNSDVPTPLTVAVAVIKSLSAIVAGLVVVTVKACMPV